MSDNKVVIFIDGVDVEAEQDHTVIQAADAAGIYIPRLCYHKDMIPGGHCRVCTIKANGRSASACTFPVSEGLMVDNNTDELNGFRRSIIELLFVEGNHCCPSCEASGDCELQALAYRLELLAPTLPYLNKPRELDATHKDVFIDRDRCVLCGRCVRASKLVDGKTVFGFEGRGAEKRIAVDSDCGLGGTSMDVADKAAEICPTGCLKIKREGFKVPVGQRKYDKAVIGSDIERT